MFPSEKQPRRPGDERGFGLLQMVVALAVAGVVTGIAVFGIRGARSSMRLYNSARVFAQAAERARLDAIRRRTTSFVEFTKTGTYEVTMDFTGTGTEQTRAFTLDSGVFITDADGNALPDDSDAMPYALFDWRGRTGQCNMLFNLKNDRGDRVAVQIAGSGDITVNSGGTNVPVVSYTPVSATADVNPTAALYGDNEKMNLCPCNTTCTGGTTTGGGGGPPPPQQCIAGQMTPSTTYISDLRRNGLNTRTVTISVTGPGTITITPDSTGNLSVSPSATQNITSSSGGSVAYTIRSVTKSVGTFNVTFSYSNCSTTVTVKVTK